MYTRLRLLRDEIEFETQDLMLRYIDQWHRATGKSFPFAYVETASLMSANVSPNLVKLFGKLFFSSVIGSRNAIAKTPLI